MWSFKPQFQVTFTRCRLILPLVLGAFVLVCLYLAFPSPRLLPSDVADVSIFSSGDVVLFSSATCRGWLVRMSDFGQPYAHVGLIDADHEGIWVIHADPEADTVLRQKLDSYLLDNEVSRMAVLTVAAPGNEKAVSFARNAATNRIPFDNDFKYDEGDGIYCTELVLRAWREAGIHLIRDVKRGDAIPPSRLLKSPCCRTKWCRQAR